ncbi:MAG: TPM domain-containing protein [Acetivibrio sp.]
MVKLHGFNKPNFFLLILCLCFLCCGTNVMAAEEQNPPLEYVVDGADIFSDEEETQLLAECQALFESQDIHAVLLTTNSIDSTRKQYIEDYYDSREEVLGDAVLLLINMQSDDRGVEIQGYGSCEFTISDDRISSILDEILPYLKEAAYYDAASAFLQLCDFYISQGASTNQQHTQADNDAYNEVNNPHASRDAFIKQSFFNLMIGLILGAVVVFIMAYQSGGKMTASQSTYLDSGSSKVLGHYDRYIRTTTSRIPKPKPQDNSSGSGFGGGVSSGGNSHSGGGSSF